jgi:hypothetical protein
MKKLVLITVLALLTLPAFAQEKDSRAPFQGVWYEVTNREDKFIYIFIDDIFIFTNLYASFSWHYSVEDNNLITTNPRKLGVDGWSQDKYTTDTIKYLFSDDGDRLILVLGKTLMILSRDPSDFPKWVY